MADGRTCGDCRHLGDVVLEATLGGRAVSYCLKRMTFEARDTPRGVPDTGLFCGFFSQKRKDGA